CARYEDEYSDYHFDYW
nr:immunoglobulin heavy chain junction region [Macaca mulatta]MOX62951.1 immunoglobulin heavy chain junction region [Macaca mulatta]MOX63084.1 immunoglobulin heavy chain junction region [Macaca mulatta]MOX63465.1 immunoglobulin heavy chain junction region [Macaca mulatta]MOX63596.1 immunoglobulin heavy chain junction region [Macaca mulatta]